jgi:hypothetical protein
VKLTGDQARELLCCRDLPDLGLTIEADEHIGERRWVSEHFLVVKDRDGKLWAATYDRGLTEYQDTEPFEDEAEVGFYEVEKVPVTTYIYRKAGQ